MPKIAFLFLLVVGLRYDAQAQVINFDTLSIYPASVVLKVYDVGIRTSLTVEQQLTLANLFFAEENDLVDGVFKALNFVEETNSDGEINYRITICD